MHRYLIAGLTLFALLCGLPAAAQEPFYYPAYGAWRGKIINRSGPFGYRQKVRWGGGLTEAGAGVLTSAIQAAGPIISTFAGRELEGEGDEDRAQRQADFQRSIDSDRQLLREAETLLAQTRALYVDFGGQPGTPSTGGEGFDDWDNSGLNPGGGQGQPGDFSDWDNSGFNPGGATNPLTPGGSGDDFGDWDNRP